ncbi:MAG: hypothetical protein V3V00_05490 [Saprospiraceae bacterium]
MNKLLLAATILIITLFLLSNCNRDQLVQIEMDCDENVTYTSLIKPIIDESCAYSGCHDGAGGIGPGDYTQYNGILGHLNGGSFRSRTIDQKDSPSIGMPPDMSVYAASLKDNLTDEEFEMITCWLDNNFPE